MQAVAGCGAQSSGLAPLPREVAVQGQPLNGRILFYFQPGLERTPLSLGQAAPVEPVLKPPVIPLCRKWPPDTQPQAGFLWTWHWSRKKTCPSPIPPSLYPVHLHSPLSELEISIPTLQCSPKAGRGQGLGPGCTEAAVWHLSSHLAVRILSPPQQSFPCSYMRKGLRITSGLCGQLCGYCGLARPWTTDAAVR